MNAWQSQKYQKTVKHKWAKAVTFLTYWGKAIWNEGIWMKVMRCAFYAVALLHNHPSAVGINSNHSDRE